MHFSRLKSCTRPPRSARAREERRAEPSQRHPAPWRSGRHRCNRTCSPLPQILYASASLSPSARITAGKTLPPPSSAMAEWAALLQSNLQPAASNPVRVCLAQPECANNGGQNLPNAIQRHGGVGVTATIEFAARLLQIRYASPSLSPSARMTAGKTFPTPSSAMAEWAALQQSNLQPAFLRFGTRPPRSARAREERRAEPSQRPPAPRRSGHRCCNRICSPPPSRCGRS